MHFTALCFGECPSFWRWRSPKTRYFVVTSIISVTEMTVFKKRPFSNCKRLGIRFHLTIVGKTGLFISFRIFDTYISVHVGNVTMALNCLVRSGRQLKLPHQYHQALDVSLKIWPCKLRWSRSLEHDQACFQKAFPKNVICTKDQESRYASENDLAHSLLIWVSSSSPEILVEGYEVRPI